MTLGERIKTIRELYKLPQQEFGAKIGLSQAYLSKLEANKKYPSDKVVYAICRNFGVNIDWLLTGEGEMKLPPGEYISEGIAIYGAENFSEGLSQLTKKLQLEKIESLLPENRKDYAEFNRDLLQHLKELTELWDNGDLNFKHWLIQEIHALLAKAKNGSGHGK